MSSVDREEYVERVLAVVEQIPAGRVMSYGSIAEVVGGWLGWRTFAAVDNHVSIFGYPGNLDGAKRLQRTDQQRRTERQGGAGPVEVDRGPLVAGHEKSRMHNHREELLGVRPRAYGIA